MEREAFARAWRFLNFKPAAKWTAMIAAVATGILYVALLVVLGLFADLMVHRGRFPALSELPEKEQKEFLQSWALLPMDSFTIDKLKALVSEDKIKEWTKDSRNLTDDNKELIYQLAYVTPLREGRRQKFASLGLPAQKAEDLAAAEPTKLAPADQDWLWQVHIQEVLSQRVSSKAAELTTNTESADRGILSLVVRSEGRFYAPLVNLMARWWPGMWNSPDQERPWIDYNYLTGLLIIAMLLALLRAAAMFLMHYGAAVATIEATTRIRRAVYHHTFRLGTLVFRALGPGEAVGIFTRQVETVHNGLYLFLTMVFREPVKFFLLLAFALAVNFWLALAFLFFALLVWLVGGQVATYFRRQERAATSAAAEHLALLQESLMMMRLVKCYLMELFNQSRVERQLAAHSATQLQGYKGEAIYKPLLIFLGTVASLVLLFVAGQIVLSGNISVASVIILATALVSLYLPLVTWLEQRRLLRRAREAATIVFKFLDRPGEVGQAIGAEFLPPLGRYLEFDNVSLKEPGTGRRLLQGVSLAIKANQKVALVSPDEMAKYALVYLLPRFLDPEAGEIRIDGKNIRWVTFDSLRAQIAMVMQHNLVFNDSVANNIGCGETSYPLPKIIEASKVAHAHHFIQKLPKGYETVVGEMGHFLSISEQYRIALARAILRDPALLIIEEPVAPLDEESKDLVDDTLTRVMQGRTVIFLPHRLSTIRTCDQVFFLHKGRIEASGEHKDLLTQNQLYRHIQYIEFNEFAELV